MSESDAQKIEQFVASGKQAIVTLDLGPGADNIFQAFGHTGSVGLNGDAPISVTTNDPSVFPNTFGLTEGVFQFNGFEALGDVNLDQLPEGSIIEAATETKAGVWLPPNYDNKVVFMWDEGPFRIGISGAIDTNQEKYAHNIFAHVINKAIGENPCSSVPENLNISNVGPSSAELSWDLQTDAIAGYDYVFIDDGSIPGSSTTPTGSVEVGVNSVLVTGLDFATTYDVYVRSDCSVNQSAWSIVETFTTLGCSAPEALFVSNITVTSVDLNWELADSEDGGYEYVLITDGTIPDASTTPTGSVDSGVSMVSLIDLDSEISYDAYVRTICVDGDLSDWSEAVSFTTASNPPIAVAQDITVQLDANGEATITPEMVDDGSSVSVGEVSLGLDITSFDCNDIGENTVILTVTDENDNSSSATAIVTVEDDLAPTVLTHNITVQLNTAGTASITPAMIDDGSFDNCEIDSSTLDISSFDCSNLGDNIVTLTITDASDNSSSETAVITVEDVSNPVAQVQDITVQLDANGQASISASDVDNASSDNCGIVSSTLDISTFDCSNVGANSVTLSVQDSNGNSSSATAVVTVEDNLDPIVETQDITIQLDANGGASISVSDVDNGSTDNCGLVSSALDISSFDCSSVGDNTVTLTLTDASGNNASATAIVTVEDVTDPIVVTQDITVQLDANGQVTISATDIDNGSTDNCSIESSTLDVLSFDCSNLGDNPVSLTVTDASGNSNSATAVVTVEDTTDPVAVTEDINLELDANGQATITAADVDNGSGDNCGTVSLSLDVTNFDCSDLGNNTVTLTVQDAEGNQSSATAVVTVQDNLDPVAVAQDITVQLDANGQATITATDIDNGSSDNCGIVSSMLDVTSFDCSNVGANTVTLTVSDASGNTVSETAVVTVEETENPVAIGQDITVELDENGNASISAVDINNGSTDNCNIANLYLDTSSFDCGDIGNNNVLFTVEDGSGNTDSVSVTVTVVDNLGPTALGQDITIDLQGNPSVSIVAVDVDNGSFDNCSNVSLSIDIDTFTSIGDYPVVLTITDDDGNVSSVTVTVTVIDTLSIDDLIYDNVRLNIFPVPAYNNLNVESNVIFESYVIVDVVGRIVLSSHSQDSLISIDSLSGGTYFIRFKLDNGKTVVRKFIKASH
jgi:hypothetical protein